MNLKLRRLKEDFLLWVRITRKTNKISRHLFMYRIEHLILKMRLLIINYRIKIIVNKKEKCANRLINRMIKKEIKELNKKEDNIYDI